MASKIAKNYFKSHKKPFLFLIDYFREHFDEEKNDFRIFPQQYSRIRFIDFHMFKIARN